MATTARKPKHIHKFMGHKYKTGQEIFFCTLPDCHFKMEKALTVGKESLCNVCGEPFIVSVAHLRLKHPHCHKCGKMRVTIDGKTKYINKSGASDEVVREIAADTTKNLRDRLDSLVNPEIKVPHSEPDEDI